MRDNRSDLDHLYEILLKSGCPPSTSIETLDLAGKKADGVAGNALIVCLERELTFELTRAI